MNLSFDDASSDQTLPPTRMLRFDSPNDLFQQMPQVAEFVQTAPEQGEGFSDYISRIRQSPTPEDAIVIIAFSSEPQVGVQWAQDAIQTALPGMSPDDMQLMNWVAEWLDMPSSDNRWNTLQRALFAPRRSAAVYLALAVGWSGGPLAPNDPVEVPAWRTPKALSSGVLRALGQVSLEQKQTVLSQMIDQALGLLRIS